MMSTQWENVEKTSVPLPEELDFEKIWFRIGEKTRSKTTRGIKVYLNTALKYAAILVFGLFSFLLGQQLEPSREKESGTHAAGTLPGTISELRLPDNSRVWLNAGSTLQYDDLFGTENRDLELTGEAVFQVRKDEKLPFRVRVNENAVTALGTEFYVSAYDFGSSFEAGLMSGSIEIQTPGHRYTLNQPRSISFHKETGRLISEEALNPAFYEWKNGKLIFDNTPLSEISYRLSNWFNFKVESEINIGDQPFTLTIVNEDIEEVLELIHLASGLKYQETGEGYRIYSSKNN